MGSACAGTPCICSIEAGRRWASSAMPAARRRSFLLNRLQGLSCAAIARMTGYSESAVKKHIGVVLTELEAALTEAERTNRSDSA